MIVKAFTTAERLIIVEENGNGSYTAYETKTHSKGEGVKILNSRSLDWLIDTLHMRYLPEKLIEVKGA